MSYVAAVGGKGAEVNQVKEQLLQSNPVLEALRNAKTVRNDSSSRFGKYMDIELDFKGDPLGGVISNYLLVKLWVVKQPRGERNFHVFYQLLSSASEELLHKLTLEQDFSRYTYLSLNSAKVNAVNDMDNFRTVRNTVQVLGFMDHKAESVLVVVAAVLKLGNIKFKPKSEAEPVVCLPPALQEQDEQVLMVPQQHITAPQLLPHPHYAGKVLYQVEGFVDKNQDLLYRDLSQSMWKASHVLIKSLFPEGNPAKINLKRPPTSGSQFKATLMKNLQTKNPNYIRCIKPNDKKAAHVFNEGLVCHQIRYLGLLENVRVRRAGYAFRQAYEPCLERYKMLCKQTWPHWKGPARGCPFLFPEGNPAKINLKRPPTSGSQFKATLMKNLQTKNPNCVTCIKPNDKKVAHVFNEGLVCCYLGPPGECVGAYLEINKNPKYKKLKDAIEEKVIIVDVVNKINHANGKSTSWVFLLTNNNFLLADQKSGQIKSEVPLVDLTKVSMSSQNDYFFYVHLKEGSEAASKGDFLFSSDHLIEMATKLYHTYHTYQPKQAEAQYRNF
ncbi:Myosin-Ib [Heterocephalus glaber]|uniref:Myosin-Ib n=1 Tax=Heterocephalus glaber TaxID=10181 RepID=G5BFA8_HETGA|nr:Myosin-Ib [Heterocephalus glaber]